jgi:hypothetical protein
VTKATRHHWKHAATAAVVGALAVAAAGCGGGGTARKQTSNAGSARSETASEAAWRQKAEEFAHELDTGLQALASTASVDANQAVANLGPLTYCSQNLGSVGSPPPVYQLAYGSLTAACEYLETGSREWRDEAAGQESGVGFDAAVFQIREGRTVLSRAEARLERFARVEPPLSGPAAAHVEDWASPIALNWWALEMQPALAEVDKKLRDGSADPIADLWAEHSGGAAGTVTACREILDRYATSPPNATATRILDHLHSSCDSLSAATDDSAGGQFDEAAYQQAKGQLNGAVTELQAVAP